ncbi:MAG: trehalose-6-phosphate synthase [Acidobacteriota bacterium]|nr:trehalose-6-phosphate synthase [Acidobacteriota bacterium]
MSTPATLRELINTDLRGAKFIAVSNREPYVHSRVDGEITCSRPAGGLTAAMDPIMRASGGVWIAHGSGSADAETADASGRIAVPPEKPSYTLRRILIDDKLHQEFYNGLANGGLWPLCHIAFTRPIFRPRDWESYKRVNQIFADAVLEEAGDGPEPAFVFIQDYHFALLPRMLKDRNPRLIVAQFWHIPWPNREAFRAFPWKEELLDGLLGNDLLGFHLRYHCTNFLETVDRNLECLVNPEQFNVVRNGGTTLVRPFPISIDYDAHQAIASSEVAEKETAWWREQLNLQNSGVGFLGVGIDRIDYTKGIPDRLLGLDLFLEQNPEYRSKVQFVQIGVPSRVGIGEYQALNAEIDETVEYVNKRWSTNGWSPIVFYRRSFNLNQLIGLHKLAHFCVVTSLHDGMNLVAKEYVASRLDNTGVLILSRFTGSARELHDALLVNPFAIGEIAEAIATAVRMSHAEQNHRMLNMRRSGAEHNIYDWATKILTTLFRFNRWTHEIDDDTEEEAESL